MMDIRNTLLRGQLSDWRDAVKILRIFIYRRKVDKKLIISLEELEKVVDELESKLMSTDKYQLLNLINENGIKRKNDYSKYIDDLIKHQSNFVEGLKNYSQLIITAGYATFFGLWTQSELYLSQFESVLAITMLSVSAAVFVLHEVLGLLLTNLSTNKRNKALLKAKLEDSYAKLNHDLDSCDRYENTLSLVRHKSWKYFYTISFLSGILGIAILVNSYLISLWNLFSFRL